MTRDQSWFDALNKKCEKARAARDAAAFQKEEAAFNALVTFTRSALRQRT